ncbi:galactoside 2-alpha-L-fucosyltransferase-like [Miscanthus floridulus]|uniref:galactoside 2-alpha-L-fucosyltransferase-like n=1 Tax=Miscanthus floridulus TaxID=154761 RepID=UPI0034592E2B
MAKLLVDVNVKRRSWAVSAVLAAVVMTVPLLVIILSGSNFGAPGIWIQTAVAGLRKGSNDLAMQPRSSARRHDWLLGGLLVDGFDEESCHSRYQSATYRRNPGRQPSTYLISKLRRHESLQMRCGPGTAAYSNALAQLKSGKSVASPECRYIVTVPIEGLGNRILAAASAFLYALLTDRVVLVDPSNDMDNLFCEPFLGATWLLPPEGFPLASYANFSIDTAETYGNMLKNKVIGGGADAAAADVQLPAFAYVYLHSDAGIHDRNFFWDEDQRLLRHVQWLVMSTDNYIVPGLFLTKAFRGELGKMFPERDAVLHHLGRYLFHPNNHVWGLVTRYYDAYLAGATQRVGIQVRVFGGQPNSPEILEQITSCTQKHKLLPEVLAAGEPATLPASRAKKKSKAVLVTSLKPWYQEKIRSMYWEHATATGEVVSVHQPSHEEYQRFGVKSHDTKAWAEIYLLSLTDVLVTTSQSTFGYVAQGLGGLRPWVMYKPANGTVVPDPPCRRDVSMEPCFFQPPNYNLWQDQWLDASKIVPHVQRCPDFPWGGLKLVGANE